MKGFNILLVFLLMGFCVFAQEKTSKSDKANVFGAWVDETNVGTSNEMMSLYNGLSANDTLTTKFVGKVKEVCQAKGCWMKVELSNGNEAMVRFKDYGFFVPRHIAGKNVVVDGLAFVEEMSVEDQKHYAKDAGANEEELSKITTPKKTYGFEASGVLIKN
ncbi:MULTISPECIES: DUF4920 domain-containing protein [Maribacter]|uniref:DUF4920 domain-containing protein n=1 Tax=Maribacter flavus TaxID=1658664 RepID=A0A5B2TUK5_9FLAO|nr:MULTISPECIES: DUF4920 domain-containing protein [Maribacter]KAA2218206.1 DUF4920 domain-containing protein [Maribacter flavus]MDC6405075.1 DUF4920 domain-containing protein [Maribacter sp. PR66]MEE1972488.1 DUF4920 domain-containing protein [Maribacter flavus]